MIYTIITNIEKTDCRFLRQSQDFIPKNIFSYIEETSNHAQKKARMCAYSSLFFALRKIYGEEGCDVCFSKDGKPYLTDTKRHISISISHCDVLSAVCLSDEGEVGVDVQDKIDESREKRLEQRYFTDLNVEIKKKLNGEFLLFEENNGTLALNMPDEEDLIFKELSGDFTEKWSLGESILKCEGIGFGGISNVRQIQEKCDYTTIRFLVNNKEFALSISIKKTIM